MRLVALFVGTSLLAACGGSNGAIGSAGSAAAGGGGSGGTTGSTGQHTFVNPTVEKTYRGNGAMHRLVTTINRTSAGELYAGNASTVRNSPISLTYNPRDAIFQLEIAENASGVAQAIRFQDPAHRTDFGGLLEPQAGTSRLQLPGIQYLEAGSGPDLLPDQIILPAGAEPPYDRTTFFYQRPGTTTNYVTFAGFLRNTLSGNPALPAVDSTYTENLQRGAFVFGEQTANNNVPRTGSGSYTGHMLASAVINDQLDVNPSNTSVFQWIEGTSNLSVNFGASTFSLALDGRVHDPVSGIRGAGFLTAPGGSTFGARGSGRVDLVAAGGFLGQFQQAWFLRPDATRLDLLVAGSSIDGAFYGPGAEEAGGSFRIVGGTPDERIDILGIFTGRR